MGIFRRHDRRELLPVHRENVSNKDWVILLEANTIVDGSDQRVRVAGVTQAREIIKRKWPFGARFLLWVEGYNPRIHFVVFCPQLYKYDKDGRVVPLRGSDIGRFIAHSVNNKVMPRKPWYGLTSEIPRQPIVSDSLIEEYDTLIAEPTLVPSKTPPELEQKMDVKKLERTITFDQN
jgi:hypothetical protein